MNTLSLSSLDKFHEAVLYMKIDTKSGPSWDQVGTK